MKHTVRHIICLRTNVTPLSIVVFRFDYKLLRNTCTSGSILEIDLDDSGVGAGRSSPEETILAHVEHVKEITKMSDKQDQANTKPRQRPLPPPPYRVLPCRAGGRSLVGWCYMMCEPINGHGLCGRQAPHASVDTPTRRAIRAYEARKLTDH